MTTKKNKTASILNFKIIIPRWLSITFLSIIGLFLGLVLVNCCMWLRDDIRLRKDFAAASQITLLKNINGKKITQETEFAKITISYADFQSTLEKMIKSYEGDQANSQAAKDDHKLLKTYADKLQGIDEIIILENTFELDAILRELLHDGKAMVFDKKTNSYVDWIKEVDWDNTSGLAGVFGTDFCLPSRTIFFSTTDGMS